jgi:dipeptidyl aminopeptidase/acylaminoacyl peptidase
VWIEHGPPHTADSAPEDKSHLLRLSAPFDKAPELLARSRSKFERAEWLQNDPRVLLTETTGSRQWKRSTTWLADLRQPPDSWRKIFDYTEGDLATDPGRPVIERTSRGERLVRQDGSHFYLNGAAESAEGVEPFLNRFNLESGETTRIFRSRPGRYESFLSFTSGSVSDILISHESRLEPRGLRRLDLTSGRDTAFTLPSNPYPTLNGVERRLVTYTRGDGVNLSGSLYIPADHKPGERLPLVIWAYPTEYADKRIAGQIRVNSNRFIDLGFANQQQFRHLVTQGYLVLDMAEMPVVGDSRTRNDTYREQIVASAQAAIEHLDSLGLIDPRRVGIGGHSYGGFSATNQLTSSKLFAAGVATSGSFNRTMDPWGFHAEPRTLWQVPEKYFDVSPLMRADKITAPLLLIHGEADDNSGTFPVQSERFYAALKGLGATARYVTMPLEAHGYRARESVGHTLWEMTRWLDQYVKNAPPKPAAN